MPLADIHVLNEIHYFQVAWIVYIRTWTWIRVSKEFKEIWSFGSGSRNLQWILMSNPAVERSWIYNFGPKKGFIDPAFPQVKLLVIVVVVVVAWLGGKQGRWNFFLQRQKWDSPRWTWINSGKMTRRRASCFLTRLLIHNFGQLEGARIYDPR